LLSPQNQELILTLLRQLAERENINMPYEAAPGLQVPAEGIGLWEASLIGQGYSKETIRIYTWLVKRYLDDDPVPTPLSIMQSMAVKTQQGMSAQGVRNWVKALKSFFGFLKAEGLWYQDPAVAIKPPKLTQKERAIPSEEEVNKLLVTLASDRDSRRNKAKLSAWLITLITTGARRTELAMLTWDRVDFKQLQIILHGKGNKDRTVPMLPITARVLSEYRQTLPEDELRVFPTNDKRGVWDTKASNNMITRLCRKAGIPCYTAHQFRHFFATYILDHAGEGSIKVVSELLGHANPSITVNFYIHTSKQRIAKVYREAAPLAGSMALLKA
jgi:integrase/recombinase XerD